MIDTDKYTELTIDDWYNLKAHQWEEVMHSYCNLVRVNESLRFELDGKHEEGLSTGLFLLKWIEKCEELDAEVKRLQRRNEWLEEVVALAQEHGSIDLSDYGWPQWEGEEE